MNYTILEDGTYLANDGYVFQNKINKYIFKGMKLGENDSIDNYDIIEEPKEIIEESIEEI